MDLARRRQHGQVHYVTAKGTAVHEIPLPECSSAARVNGLVFSPDRDILWAATSAGLLMAHHPRSPGATFETTNVHQASREVALGPGGHVWVLHHSLYQREKFVEAYFPPTGSKVLLKEGLPEGLRHDFSFTEEGELVVLGDGQLARGVVQPPWITMNHPWMVLGLLLFLFLVFNRHRWTA